MAEKQIKVVVKKVDKLLDMNNYAEVMYIQNDLSELQNIVNGYIEAVPFPNVNNASIILNEDGKYNNLIPNIFVPEIDDVIVGNFLVVGVKGEDFCSLTEEQILNVINYINLHRVL